MENPKGGYALGLFLAKDSKRGLVQARNNPRKGIKARRHSAIAGERTNTKNETSPKRNFVDMRGGGGGDNKCPIR